MAGYGLAPYGTGLYGYATPPPSLTDNVAWAVGDRTVRIRLTAEPQHISSALNGDALNPNTWEIRQGLTTFYYVIAVTQVDAFTYDIRTLAPFPSHLTTLTLVSFDLKTATGYPFPLIELDFLGCLAAATSTVERANMSKGFALKDLLNQVGSV